MRLGLGLWMRSQKMVEHVEKGQNMLLVVLCAWLARARSSKGFSFIIGRKFDAGQIPCGHKCVKQDK
jgi:hypothetical protein